MSGIRHERIHRNQRICKSCSKTAQNSFEISSPESDITREGAMQAFMALRTQAKDNGISDMSLDDINKEIHLARMEADV